MQFLDNRSPPHVPVPLFSKTHTPELHDTPFLQVPPAAILGLHFLSM